MKENFPASIFFFPVAVFSVFGMGRSYGTWRKMLTAFFKPSGLTLQMNLHKGGMK